MCDLSPVLAALRSCTYRYANEANLQAGIAEALTGAGHDCVREHPLSASDRVDLYLPTARIAVEVKIDGGAGDVFRQVARYAEHPEVDGLILVTTRPARHAALPSTLAGKPVALFPVVAL